MSRPLPPSNSLLTVYPAGCMSGIEDSNLPWFRYITAKLRRRGYIVIPPVEVENPGYDYGGRDYEDFLRADIELCLSKCNALLLGPGWTRSRGARDEFAYAAATGKFIFFWDQAREEMIRMDQWLGVPDGTATSKGIARLQFPLENT
jgi:uncharacterized protein DUF4406